MRLKHYLFLALSATVFLAGFPAAAQDEHRFTANITFPFIVGDRTMPAGEYTFGADNFGSPVFFLRDNNGDSGVAMLTENLDGNPKLPSLTFECFGNDCVLEKITPPDSYMAYGLRKSEVEKGLHHKIGMASIIEVGIKH